MIDMKNNIMKKNLFLSFCVLMTINYLHAQDIIATTSAKKIEAKIIEVSKSEVKYKEIDNLDGPTFVIETKDINTFIYNNGKVVFYNQTLDNSPSNENFKQQEIKNDGEDKQKLVKDIYIGLQGKEREQFAEFLEGYPKNIISVKGDYSMLFDSQSRVFFDFDYSSAELVEYDVDTWNFDLKGDFEQHLKDEMRVIDKDYIIQTTCKLFNERLLENKCVFYPISDYERKKGYNVSDYILLLHILRIDVGNGNKGDNSSSYSGGAILYGYIEIKQASTNTLSCLMVADRIRGKEANSEAVRTRKLIEEVISNKLFFVQDYKLLDREEDRIQKYAHKNGHNKSQEKAWKLKGFEPQIRFSFDEGVDYQKNYSFGLDVILAYRFNEIFRLGIGAGVDYVKMRFEEAKYIGNRKYKAYDEGAMTIPVFANVKVDFLKRKVSPYLALDCGYNCFVPFSKYAKSNKLGFFIRPAFGIDIRFAKCTLGLELAYRYQARKFENILATYGGYNQLSQSISISF